MQNRLPLGPSVAPDFSFGDIERWNLRMAMSNDIPNPIKICHIVHIDKLSGILSENSLVCDAEIQRRQPIGTTIGMGKIKKRRLEELILSSHPDLHVGDCVPFYFCPRSVMLYMFYRDNHPDIDYHGGQEPILHLVADMHETILWANEHNLRWAFTASNAGSYYFDDFNSENDLNQIDWSAVRSKDWQMCQDKKQAEFLIEQRFSWELVERIGVYSDVQYRQVSSALAGAVHRPPIEIKREWYY